jgi:hypothetical protein
MDIECIYESNDFSEIESIKELLEKNDIPVMIKNMYNQNLLGGLIPLTGSDPVAGSMQIFINSNEVEKGLKLIEENQQYLVSTNTNVFQNSENEKEDEDIDSSIIKDSETKKKMILSIVFACISFAFIPYILNIVLIKIPRSRAARYEGFLLLE